MAVTAVMAAAGAVSQDMSLGMKDSTTRRLHMAHLDTMGVHGPELMLQRGEEPTPAGSGLAFFSTAS